MVVVLVVREDLGKGEDLRMIQRKEPQWVSVRQDLSEEGGAIVQWRCRGRWFLRFSNEIFQSISRQTKRKIGDLLGAFVMTPNLKRNEHLFREILRICGEEMNSELDISGSVFVSDQELENVSGRGGVVVIRSEMIFLEEFRGVDGSEG